MTRRVFSGIQPTGVPHLGNYLGALRQWKRLHDQSMDPKFSFDYRPEQFFCVVDLHALTSDTPPDEQLRLRKESFAALLAMGLINNSRTTLFFQSDVGSSQWDCYWSDLRRGLVSFGIDVDIKHHRIHRLFIQDDSVEGENFWMVCTFG